MSSDPEATSSSSATTRESKLEQPLEVDVDGYVDEKGIEYIGKALRQPDGTWTCLANVGGALCAVEVKIRMRTQSGTLQVMGEALPPVACSTEYRKGWEDGLDRAMCELRVRQMFEAEDVVKVIPRVPTMWSGEAPCALESEEEKDT